MEIDVVIDRKSWNSRGELLKMWRWGWVDALGNRGQSRLSFTVTDICDQYQDDKQKTAQRRMKFGKYGIGQLLCSHLRMFLLPLLALVSIVTKVAKELSNRVQE